MKRSIFALASLVVLAVVTVSVFGTLDEGGGKAEAAPGTITAVANGSVSPTTIAVNTALGIDAPANTVQNGNFTISPQCCAPVGPTTGDGINEHTIWTFDFCPATFEGPLTSALLTLTLTPGTGISSDSVRVIDPPGALGIINPSGPGGVAAPGLQTLYNDVGGPPTRTIQVDLLSSSPDPVHGTVDPGALRTLFDANAGEIPMYYQDDAVISFAKLELEPAGCPVGGIVELPDVDGSPLSAADSAGGSSAALYAALAGGVAAATLAAVGGGWYARRRWLR